TGRNMLARRQRSIRSAHALAQETSLHLRHRLASRPACGWWYCVHQSGRSTRAALPRACDQRTKTGGRPMPDAGTTTPIEQQSSPSFWPNTWWAIVDYKIGIIPLPVFVILIAVIGGFAASGTVPSDILMAIVILSMGGFTCAELGKRIPIIRNIGAAAIFATFIPSFLAFHHLLPASILDSVKQFTKDSNFLYLFIACIIVGSILGMDRGLLIKGFLKIFVPLAAGSVVSGIVGTVVGVLLGLGAYHTFFFIVVPIMAGGVGEGAIPLSIGYSQILHQQQGDLFAQVLPPVMLASLTAL